MLIGKMNAPDPKGGRELLGKLNRDVLQSLYGSELVYIDLPARNLKDIRGYLSAFRGHMDGLNAETIRSALAIIDGESAEKVFLDGSNLGGIIPFIKRRRPAVEVITFFHNVEARFFWGSFLARRTPRALAVLMANYLAERKAVRGSDKIVCLSERDSRMLKRLYGRGATHIAPMALEDQCPAELVAASGSKPERFALFVGGTFYANRDGIAWFVREVVPRIDLPLYIVGRGFEAMRAELEVPGKVVVVGAVDSLADWYRRARFVIAPIFDGSGMKTKVAEALMFGKKIIGTAEAFSGYEDVAEGAGWCCATADDFVAALAEAEAMELPEFDPALRALYEGQFSRAAACKRMAHILGIANPKNPSHT
ncbi:glycosyltransferase [Consotaella aegiceratis]|uniref:glycosyltransferase n=1 Tax=Consotaella aegiceratis TaxID=3097961 RepID=UPI002F418766